MPWGEPDQSSDGSFACDHGWIRCDPAYCSSEARYDADSTERGPGLLIVGQDVDGAVVAQVDAATGDEAAVVEILCPAADERQRMPS